MSRWHRLARASICVAFVSTIVSGAMLAKPVQSSAKRSAWDGIYTEEQSKRGAKVSAEQCTRCHGQGLTGVELASPLVGDLFNANWDGVPLADLFDRIRTSMPQDAPGSLSRQQTADVIAYLLKIGTFPSGGAELVTEPTQLAEISFLSTRPQP